MAPSAKNYDMSVYPVQMAVRSQSDGAAVHMVTLPYCDCADFTNRKGRAVETEGGQAVTVCKHLLAGLERVGGWHRDAEPTEAIVLGGRDQPVVFPNITQVVAKVILRGALVGMGARDSNHLFTEARDHADGIAEFKAALCGATVDGQVQVDPLRGRCTLTLYPGR
jgi:hypothetical protein